MDKYIVAHDVGTSSDKAVLIDIEGRVHGSYSQAYETHYPNPGWAEQDPEGWWRAVTQTTRLLLEKTGVSPSDVVCLTCSTQMLGIVPMDSGKGPLRPAIIWLDNRAGKQASRLMRKFINSRVFALIAGAPLGGKDGIPKLLWLKEKEPDIYKKMCCFLDVDGYLIYRGTGNMVMEWTGASVFGLDLKKKTWLKGIFRYVVYALMDKMVDRIPPGSDYLIFTPWMYGERAPIDDCYVRSSFLNLSADHTRENLLRAVYEGVAYNIRWIVEIVEKEFKFPLPHLRVIGGGAKGKPWMQILADVTQRNVEAVCAPQDAGAVGAALIAAVGLGIYPDFGSLKKVVKIEETFEPQEKNCEIYDSLFHSYQEVYSNLRGFYSKLNKKRFDEANL